MVQRVEEKVNSVYSFRTTYTFNENVPEIKLLGGMACWIFLDKKLYISKIISRMKCLCMGSRPKYV
jgi:hypothetical protein